MIYSINCNNFTSECCEFLTGKPLPEYIIGLSKEVTPLGKMIKPMIHQLQNNLMQNSNPMHLTQYFEGPNNRQQPTNALSNSGTTTAIPDIEANPILEPNDLFSFKNLLNTEEALIVDFFYLLGHHGNNTNF